VANGGGSSFVRPVLVGWTGAASKRGMHIDYTVLGTGEAQNQVLAGDIDFSAVELPMPADKLDMANLVQFPAVFGVMTVVVNLDGIVDRQLKLDAALLGGIFSGSIKTWKDPRIAAANPDLKLPDVEVHPVFLGRPDGSVYSTSTTLARYLIDRNEDWKQRFPTGLLTRWSVGSMVPDAGAMVPVVKALQGSVGYMALGTALSGKLTQVTLRNKAGELVQADAASLKAAVAQVDWSAPDMVVKATDLPGAGVWPLVLPTYVVIPRTPRNKARGDLVRAFLEFVLKEGDDLTVASHALPLTPAARDKVLALLAKA
jgi:phosphate transport system substrate-binding protein